MVSGYKRSRCDPPNPPTTILTVATVNCSVGAETYLDQVASGRSLPFNASESLRLVSGQFVN